MKNYFLIGFIFFILINLSSSSVEEEAQKLIKKIQDEGKTQDVGVYIAKFGTEKAIQECHSKKLGSEDVCRRVVEIAYQKLDSMSKELIKKIKNKNKWNDVINYIKKHGKDKATEACTIKQYSYKAVCRMVVEIAVGGVGSPYKREKTSNGSIVLTPKSGNYKYVLIFLHGLNGSPEDFVDTFDKTDGVVSEEFKIILPRGSHKVSGGYSWFDISVNKGQPIDLNTLDRSEFAESSSRIKSIIKDEAKKVDYENIFVGGFSQGACLTYDIGLTFDKMIGGIGCFCSAPYTKRNFNPTNIKKLNIFAYLGKNDEYFPLKNTKKEINSLLPDNNYLTIKEYNSGHKIIGDGFSDFKKFIANKIK